MPRIGNKTIQIPEGVSITVSDTNLVAVKNSHTTLTQKVDPDIKVQIENNTLSVQSPTQHKRHKSLQGLYRSLIQNMITGLTQGFTKKLEIIGIGYKVKTVKPNLLQFSLGYAHTIHFLLPKEIEATIEPKAKYPTIVLKSSHKQLLGHITAKIRALRKPEPYKGKGIRIQGEYVRRKQGKAASA